LQNTSTTRIEENKMPGSVVIAIVVISITPFLFNMVGIDFSSQAIPFEVSQISGLQEAEITDLLHRTMRGGFTHTLLEWSAFIVALFTVFLAFVHFKIKKDVTTPIIGVALFCAGSMDAFHTLAADRLIEAVAENTDLIPFTWAISRIFNAAIIIAGAGIFLIKKAPIKKESLSFLVIVSLLFGGISFIVINISASSVNLPQTMYPGSFITRPYDVMPLVFFAIAGLWILPWFYRKNANIFSHALIISMIPAIVTQLHMAFGSTALYDNHFNIAHFLKIIAYLVPFTGLSMDYIRSYEQEIKTADSLHKEIGIRERAEKKQIKLMEDLTAVNKDLKDFAYIVSHDLKAPLRAIKSLSDWLYTDNKDKLGQEGKEHIELINGRVKRMEKLIEGILKYSRAGNIGEEKETIDVNEVIEDAINSVHPPVNVEISVKSNMPIIKYPQTQIFQIVQNLLSNSVKFMDKDKGKIEIDYSEENGYWTFSFADNGPGIDKKYYDKIFQVFQTLKSRDEFESTGIGLSVVKKIVEGNGGKVWVESELGIGSTFYFTVVKIG